MRKITQDQRISITKEKLNEYAIEDIKTKNKFKEFVKEYDDDEQYYYVKYSNRYPKGDIDALVNADIKKEELNGILKEEFDKLKSEILELRKEISMYQSLIKF